MIKVRALQPSPFTSDLTYLHFARRVHSLGESQYARAAASGRRASRRRGHQEIDMPRRLLADTNEERALSDGAARLSVTLSDFPDGPVQVLDGSAAPLSDVRLQRVVQLLERTAKLIDGVADRDREVLVASGSMIHNQWHPDAEASFLCTRGSEQNRDSLGRAVLRSGQVVRIRAPGHHEGA